MKKIKDFLLEDKKNIIIIIGLILVILLMIWFATSNYGSISEDKVKEIVYKKTKFEKDKVNFRKIELDKDKDQYNVEISYNAVILSFVIDSHNGKIIENTYDDYPDKDFKAPKVEYDTMSKSDVKELIANEIGAEVKDINFKKVSLDKNIYSAVYSIKAIYKNYKYEYKVDAISKSIILRYNKKTKI